jgi:hypothetical protein
MNKPTQQQVIEAYKKLPPPVQEFLADPDQLARVLTDIRNTYDLHIDVIGQVNESIGYLLLGLVSASEFRDTLKTAGVPGNTINDIIVEINKRIFVPLREEEMKSGTGNVQQPAKPVFPAGLPQGSSPSAPEPKKYLHLDNRIPPRPAQSLRPSVSVATPVPPRFVVSPRVPPQGSSALQNGLAAIHHQPLVTPATPPPSPKAMERQGSQTSLPTKPVVNEKLLEDHEEPHIEFSKAPGSLVETPLRQALRTVIPPANLPGTFQSRPTPVEGRPSPRPDVASGEAGPIIPKVEPPVSPKSSVPAAPAKPYSGDPYREPIEP